MKKSTFLSVVVYLFSFNSFYSFAQYTCTTAIQASQGINYASGPSSGNGCFNCTSAINANWFYFSAPLTGIAQISGCIDPDDIDTRLWVYNGNCNNLVLIASDDDGCPGAYGSLVSFEVNYGDNIFLEYDDAWSTDDFEFELTFAIPNTCKDSTDFIPICADNFTETVQTVGLPDAMTTDPQNNYGCVALAKAPLWFYFKTEDSGHINIQITNTNNIDIDFALWGPYNSLTQAANECATGYPAPAQCDFSTSAAGNFYLPVIHPKDIYIVLVSQIGNTETNILFRKSGGNASSDCSFLNETCADTIVPGVFNPGDGCLDASCGITITEVDQVPAIESQYFINPIGPELISGSTNATSNTWEVCGTYYHKTLNSNSAIISVDFLVRELNGTAPNECNFIISNIYVFENHGCNLPFSIGNLELNNLIIGNTYSICISGFATNKDWGIDKTENTLDDGLASDGICNLEGIALAITPISNQITCNPQIGAFPGK